MFPDHLRRAREVAHLDAARFAALADVDHARLVAAEQGALVLSPAEADRCARTLGLRLRDLLAGDVDRAPLALLLRSSFDAGSPSLDELEATGVHQVLGEFLRAVKDVAELELALGVGAALGLEGLLASPELQRGWAPTSSTEHPAEAAARVVRAHFQLGLDPIPSMRKLCSDALGVQVFWVTTDVLDPVIDGASTRRPRPALLVNLVGGGRSWWRTRMTIAHELAHLLFDEAERPALLSPRRPVRSARPWRWRLFEGFDELEVRADAFAACLLAPGVAVRHAVGARDPSSEEAVGVVGSTFGVGRIVAINRLQDVFGLSDEDRRRMGSRDPIRYHSAFEADVVEDGVGLRSGVLRTLVREALAEGRIARSTAWACLDLPVTEPLPYDDLPPAQRAPLSPPEDALRACAQRLLVAHRGRVLHAVAVRAQGTRCCVDVVEGGFGERTLTPAGYLVLSPAGALLEDHVTPATP
ncbi:MAG: ImmA/IrrE family metallo-endopeptidase [Deltaproteobacteria bacterium]|nr:ImmA/IrrE family metallo-endopeptidase [Deltaproteobacteria bacterium]